MSTFLVRIKRFFIDLRRMMSRSGNCRRVPILADVILYRRRAFRHRAFRRISHDPSQPAPDRPHRHKTGFMVHDRSPDVGTSIVESVAAHDAVGRRVCCVATDHVVGYRGCCELTARRVITRDVYSLLLYFSFILLQLLSAIALAAPAAPAAGNGNRQWLLRQLSLRITLLADWSTSFLEIYIYIYIYIHGIGIRSTATRGGIDVAMP